MRVCLRLSAVQRKTLYSQFPKGQRLVQKIGDNWSENLSKVQHRNRFNRKKNITRAVCAFTVRMIEVLASSVDSGLLARGYIGFKCKTIMLDHCIETCNSGLFHLISYTPTDCFLSHFEVAANIRNHFWPQSSCVRSRLGTRGEWCRCSAEFPGAGAA